MKKLVAFVMATVILAAFLVPVVLAAPSPERPGMVTVATKEDMPAASADSPDFVYVESEGVVYAKYNDPETGYVYLPEDQVPSDDKYQIVVNGGTQNAGAQWTSGSGNSYVISVDAPKDKFVSVVLDGVVLDPKYYTIQTTSDGGTEIVIKPEYLATLGAGKHSFAVKLTDGVVKSDFTVKAQQGGSSQTGDDSNTSTWVAVGLIALGVVSMLSLTLVKTRKSAGNK